MKNCDAVKSVSHETLQHIADDIHRKHVSDLKPRKIYERQRSQYAGLSHKFRRKYSQCGYTNKYGSSVRFLREWECKEFTAGIDRILEARQR